MDYRGKIIIKSTESGDLYFNVVGENGNIISTSKIYDNRKDLDKGIVIMKKIFGNESLNIVEEEPNIE